MFDCSIFQMSRLSLFLSLNLDRKTKCQIPGRQSTTSERWFYIFIIISDFSHQTNFFLSLFSLLNNANAYTNCCHVQHMQQHMHASSTSWRCVDLKYSKTANSTGKILLLNCCCGLFFVFHSWGVRASDSVRPFSLHSIVSGKLVRKIVSTYSYYIVTTPHICMWGTLSWIPEWLGCNGRRHQVFVSALFSIRYLLSHTPHTAALLRYKPRW